MNNSKSLLNIDLGLIIVSILLISVGILFVYSSGINSFGTQVTYEYVRQIAWAALGIILIFSLAFLNYTVIREMSIFFYLFFLLLLIFTLFFGRVVNNSKSWLGFFGLGIQPSEFMKIAYVLFLSSFFSTRSGEIHKPSIFLQGLVLTIVPVLLILRQPDLGTALVFFPIFIAISFLAGVPGIYLFFFTAVGALSVLFGVLPIYFERITQTLSFIVPMISTQEYMLTISGILLGVFVLSLVGFLMLKRKMYFWTLYSSAILLLGLWGGYAFRGFLKEYQIMRLVTFLNPNIDPQGAGWNIIQSLNAVGSGGFSGKGFLQGTQSQLRYIPMQSTDFIFSIVAEEWGFIGGLFIIGLYIVILWRGTLSIIRSRDNFGTLIAAGFLMMFFFHLILNIGMNIGIMPITGIPLLFISYGGSSMLSAAMAMGFILSVQRRRFLF